jgi:hypothetical protein
MVDHLTRITVDSGAERAADLVRALALQGFSVRRERDRLVAESDRIEAQDAKRYLRSLGFPDRDYQVFLEYVRAWGVL